MPSGFSFPARPTAHDDAAAETETEAAAVSASPRFSVGVGTRFSGSAIDGIGNGDGGGDVFPYVDQLNRVYRDYNWFTDFCVDSAAAAGILLPAATADAESYFVDGWWWWGVFPARTRTWTWIGGVDGVF